MGARRAFVVYEFERRLVQGVIQVDGWPEDAAFHPGGCIVLSYDNVGLWLAHDIDTGERLGPVRQAWRALAHPSRPVVGWADTGQIWIEAYSFDGG